MSRSTNSIREGLAHARHAYRLHNQKTRRKQLWKIAFHVALHPSFSRQWFAMLRTPFFADILPYRPRLYLKPFRTYMAAGWRKDRKIKVVGESYIFLKKSFPDFYEKVLQVKDGFTLTSPILSDTTQYVLKIGYDERFRKEGEFILYVEDGNAEKVISVSFSFEQQEKDNWVCLVGCVQGNPLASFRSLQKTIHSMRPNNFIIFCLQELSRNLGCRQLLGVRDASQVNRRKHFIHIESWHKIDFSYDDFWKSADGEVHDRDWFILPLEMPRREETEMKTHKRNMYRKRYAMLDQIGKEIRASIVNRDP